MASYQELVIKNFGPIGNARNKPLKFKRCTVFIGDQGSGKSSVVKLYSTLTWLEKYIIAKKNTSIRSLKEFKNILSQQNIPNEYINKDTVIEYISKAIHISIINNRLEINKIVHFNDEYICPKIQYVPSERNILSVASKLKEIAGIPEMLTVFNREFELACENINNIVFQKYILHYDSKKRDNYVYIKNKNAEVKLSQASSGLQSVFPLIFVSNFIKKRINENFLERLRNSDDIRRQNVVNLIGDASLKDKINTYIMSKVNKLSVNEIKALEKNFLNIINSCFIEIVEEPEQNLFPLSQVEILNNLIKDTSGEGDKLIITTHSPYILSQLNNYIFADEKKTDKNNSFNKKYKNLFIPYKDISAFKIENGKIKSIKDKDFRGINVSEIDKCSRNISKEFEEILDMETK